MPDLRIEKRIKGLRQLGEYLKDLEKDEIKIVTKKASLQNPWFTEKFIRFAFEQFVANYFEEENLREWVQRYNIQQFSNKTIALVLAGNIPMVGLHDILCCYIAGHNIQIKLSEKDKVLIPFIINALSEYDPSVVSKLEYVDMIKNFDAVIATGSNRAGIYFESYFSKYPHIIRKNRNAVAILDGNESRLDWQGLANDIFTYFGLGCRNISKIYLPKGYKLEPLLEYLHDFNEVILHHKYKNNFDYSYALFMLNKDKFFMNGAIILKEDTRIASRIASLHYEYYNDLNELQGKLLEARDKIQCVSGNIQIDQISILPFGTCQTPALDQYADGVDTMQFLTNL